MPDGVQLPVVPEAVLDSLPQHLVLHLAIHVPKHQGLCGQRRGHIHPQVVGFFVRFCLLGHWKVGVEEQENIEFIRSLLPSW